MIQLEEQKDTAATLQMKKSIHKRIQEIIKNPISPRTLLELEQTARLSRELLSVCKEPSSINGVHINNASYINGVYQGQSYLMDSPLAPSPQTETYGATVIKELLGAKAGNKDESMLDVIKAIALAKDNNLPDIADKLKTQFFGTKSAPELTQGESK